MAGAPADTYGNSSNLFQYYSTIAKSTENTTADGDHIQITDANSPNYIDEVSATLTYLGWCVPGSATSSPVFRIKEIKKTGNVTTNRYVNGSMEYFYKWDDRAVYSYL
jgi:hypothetical protein